EPVTNLALDKPISLQATTSGFTDHVLRGTDGQGRTGKIDSKSDARDRIDATFTVRKGMSNNLCYSFESVNYPGQYLYAPSGDKGQQIGVGTIDGANRRTEATFCAFKNVGSKDGIILKNSMPNNPEKYIRHVDGKVWADPALKSISNQNTFAQDMVWKVIDPLWNVEPVTNL
ncbi:AbfB domain-containing protein, partial [Chryseobacterium sp. c4a]|uniref:AbfB domain-containing protein n=1 Tax=Chryseobacterium sp. c4a TaxID=1573582 RepID=UPI0016294163